MNYSKGSTLIENVVALVILTTVMIPLISLFIRSSMSAQWRRRGDVLRVIYQHVDSLNTIEADRAILHVNGAQQPVFIRDSVPIRVYSFQIGEVTYEIPVVR